MARYTIEQIRYPIIGVVDYDAWPTYLSVVGAIALYFELYDFEEVANCTGVPTSCIRELCADASCEEDALERLSVGTVRERRAHLEALTGLAKNRRHATKVAQRKFTGFAMPEIGKTLAPIVADLVSTWDLLPYESAVSGLGRVIAVNRLSRTVIAQHMTRMRRVGFSKPPFARLLLSDTSQLWASLGWNESLEGLIARSIPYLAGVLFAEQFRFCPRCVESGYHSIFHQLFFVHRCPVHETAVLDKCPFCRQASPIHKVLGSSGQFCCGSCNRSLSGSRFSLRRRLEFGQNTMQWKEAFSSLCRWIADVHIELWPIERIIATNPDCELVWAAWTTALEFLRKATLDLYPPPAEYRFDSNPTILKLEWDLTSKQDESAEFFPETALDLNHRHSIRSRGASPAEAKSSYLAVVDHLTDWILSDASDTGGRLLEVQSYITAFSEGRLFRVVGSDHRLVSLAALMFLFEKNAVVGGQHRFRSLRVDADSMLSGHNSRARRQAFLIGLYACLFSAIRRHASLGEDVSVESLVSFRSIYSVPHSTIPGPTPFSGRALSAGIVLCPVVEGLSSMRASDSNDPA